MLPVLSFESITVDPVFTYTYKEIEVHVLRLDKISPLISGNKWFKLRYYLEEAKTQQKKGLLTFGGAWSNHIIATAAACRMDGLQSIGIIRGEEPRELSATLRQAKEFGMQLVFISRSAYHDKEIPSTLNTADYLIVHEGGYGETGAKGASSIVEHCDRSYTHYCCAVGTGTMMAGIINAIPTGQQVIGISVLKNNLELESSTQALITRYDYNNSPGHRNWRIIHDYSFGGYAKYQPALLAFMNEFYSQTGIPTDFVYTGKLFFAVSDLIGKNYFPPGSKLLLVHSGGLQGNTSIPTGTLMF